MRTDSLRIGMIGLSEGNGHPYSFSAIFNGFKKELMKEAWVNIYNYLIKQPESSIGIENAKITHIWTQDRIISEKISSATNIEHVVDKVDDMLEYVDAVIIARDDYHTHLKYAKSFLEAGIYVFIDKPLSLNIDELFFFLPYLQNAQLMSSSGIRYAPELDKLKKITNPKFKLINGVVAKDWEKYAIHILEGVYSIIDFDIDAVQVNEANHESVTIFRKNGGMLNIDALNGGPSVIKFDFYSELNYFGVNTLDAFTAFKRTMEVFVGMINTNIQPINPDLTINLMKVLIAKKKSLNESRKVYLSEII